MRVMWLGRSNQLVSASTVQHREYNVVDGSLVTLVAQDSRSVIYGQVMLLVTSGGYNTAHRHFT